MNENTSESLSNEPITQDAALEQIMGIVNPKGQIEDESVTEPEIESSEEVEEVEVEAEAEETEEPVDPDAPAEVETLEFDDAEFENYQAIREFAKEHGIESPKDYESGYLRQSDYTRKTQALADERKAFESQKSEQLEETARLLEIAQAIVYGDSPQVKTDELLKLRESDPSAYEEALEKKVLWDARKAEIDSVSQKVAEQHRAKLEQEQQAYFNNQAELAQQLIPELADEKKAKDIVSDMSKYLESIGQSPDVLNEITDARMLKVLYDASSTKPAVQKPKGPKRVIRKATSTSKAEKQAAAKKDRLRKATMSDGSISQDAAVDLILESFN